MLSEAEEGRGGGGGGGEAVEGSSRREEEEAARRRRLTDVRAANLRKNRVRHAISQCSNQVTRPEYFILLLAASLHHC